jgi:hypothetical protein
MRELNTPIVLWICAAICAHFLLGEGGEQVALFHDDGMALASLGAKVREKVRDREQTFDISPLDVTQPKPPEPEPAPADTVKPPPPKPPVAKKEPEPPKEEPKKPEPKKIAILPKPPEPEKKLEPPPQVDHRIAVRQHVKPKQEDNPTARFLGDDANHVDKETVATQTSHDQDDPNPTPGASHAGPAGSVGDSERTKIADSDTHAGEKNRGPGERGTELEVQPSPMPTRPQGATAIPGQAGAAASGGDGRPAGAPTDAQPGQAGPVSPGSAVVIDENGNWSFNPEQKPGTGAAEGANGPAKKQGASVATTTWLGLGGKAGPGQVNLNMNQSSVVASVGQDQLTRERVADGERRSRRPRSSAGEVPSRTTSRP